MRSKKVLIADDDRGIRTALKARLAKWGYKVVECSDGLGVITHAVAEDVDAMILDYEMPHGDGQTVARMIRCESDAPIIFLSGHVRETFRPVVFELADVYYLPKPIESERLRTLLQDCITGYRGAPAGASA